MHQPCVVVGKWGLAQVIWGVKNQDITKACGPPTLHYLFSPPWDVEGSGRSCFTFCPLFFWTLDWLAFFQVTLKARNVFVLWNQDMQAGKRGHCAIMRCYQQLRGKNKQKHSSVLAPSVKCTGSCLCVPGTNIDMLCIKDTMRSIPKSEL